MIQKVLIANRGEIALRIIKTCKRMGIETVSVYSDADASALHVQHADVAIPIGGMTPGDSYLRIDKILAAAQKSGADAIHPGYGFLSENPNFSEAVTKAGLIFIGPSADAIRLLGDKTAAKALAVNSGVPVSPGSAGAVTTESEVRAIAESIGFPVILKAASGGGGKGMRVVFSADELGDALKSAQREAITSFGDERVFIEKFIVNPRHIEIQILADSHGNAIYFPERECSIQRRHQKVIEESPSMAINSDTLTRIGEACKRLIAGSNYSNAGTLEFLLDEDGSLYFMEVNTRLQVEHPVTEMVTGVDFVEHMIKIASGLPLELTQETITASGHAIECRICAEDVYNDFLPSTGTIRSITAPSGEHIRNESALYPGYDVNIYYDPMVAKLVVWGNDRQEATQRMIEALSSYSIAGIKTTIPFCLSVLQSEQFQSGNYSTKYVEWHWSNQIPAEQILLAKAAAAAYKANYDVRRKPESFE